MVYMYSYVIICLLIINVYNIIYLIIKIRTTDQRWLARKKDRLLFHFFC
jgi:hypothetical protein